MGWRTTTPSDASRVWGPLVLRVGGHRNPAIAGFALVARGTNFLARRSKIGDGHFAYIPLVNMERSVMDHRTEKNLGTLLLRMAQDARKEGDIVSAELLAATAIDYFDEAEHLASRWQQFDARFGDQLIGTPVTRH